MRRTLFFVSGLIVVAAACVVAGLNRLEGAGLDSLLVGGVVDLGVVTCDSDAVAHFDLENTSDSEIQIIGIQAVCTEHGCMESGVELPLVIPPGRVYNCVITCHFTGPGRFVGSCVVYTDRVGEEPIRLTAHAEVTK